ncbi:MAG: MarR family transcriptional regulator [Clostridia bacterium]|nr:MarR family transcriptional regulator [Clostridia bacterium]
MTLEYEQLKLENQICFPLYACSREVIKKYTPFLSDIDLTYTQYLAMMVLWEKKELSVKELGEKLHLDSGTLSPMLKSLEKKGLICRSRSSADERVLMVKISEDGENLKEKAKDIPLKMAGCVNLDPEDAKTLYTLLYKLIGKIK